MESHGGSVGADRSGTTHDTHIQISFRGRRMLFSPKAGFKDPNSMKNIVEENILLFGAAWPHLNNLNRRLNFSSSLVKY